MIMELTLAYWVVIYSVEITNNLNSAMVGENVADNDNVVVHANYPVSIIIDHINR